MPKNSPHNNKETPKINCTSNDHIVILKHLTHLVKTALKITKELSNDLSFVILVLFIKQVFFLFFLVIWEVTTSFPETTSLVFQLSHHLSQKKSIHFPESQPQHLSQKQRIKNAEILLDILNLTSMLKIKHEVSHSQSSNRKCLFFRNMSLFILHVKVIAFLTVWWSNSRGYSLCSSDIINYCLLYQFCKRNE